MQDLGPTASIRCMARNKLEEIVAKLARGKGQGGWRGSSELRSLEREWRRGGGPHQLPPQFIAIRLVTILEVFTRDWVAELVDAGDPYTGRAAKLLKGSLKIDYAMAQALVGKQVSFGELVSHEISVNGIGDIADHFKDLLDADLFSSLRGITDPWAMIVDDEPPPPLLPDPEWARKQIHRLFEARHIIVHELPANQSDEVADIADFVMATCQFVAAADRHFDWLLRGDYPVTQAGMNAVAAEKAEQADAELQEVLARLDPDGRDAALAASQQAWTEYRRLQAEYRSGINDPSPGSMAPMLYSDEFERITRDRTVQLDWYLTCEEGDLCAGCGCSIDQPAVG